VQDNKKSNSQISYTPYTSHLEFDEDQGRSMARLVA